VTAVAEPRAEIDLGHPVRSFVAVLVAIALALVVVQWSGFANPRVSPTNHSATYLAAPAQTFSIQVRNDAPLPVEVTGLAWPATNVASQEVGIVPSAEGDDDDPLTAELRPFEPFTLDGGETVWLGVRVLPDCGATIGDPTLEVRTRSGLRHEVAIPQGGQDVGEPCEQP
jgi:hypothetical protein